LLAMVIEKATGMTISQYLSQKLWVVLGMEYPAFMEMDRAIKVDKEKDKLEEGLIPEDINDIEPIEKTEKDLKKEAKLAAKKEKEEKKAAEKRERDLKKKEGKSGNTFAKEAEKMPLNAKTKVVEKPYEIPDIPLAKSFAGIYASPKDFAKFGRLYLKKGKWNRYQLIPSGWVDKSYYCEDNASKLIYSYGWWHTTKIEELGDTTYIPYVHLLDVVTNKKTKFVTYYALKQEEDIFAQGKNGQFIYIDPGKNLIIVRLGREKSDFNWISFFKEISKRL
jgi:CubicO group peptidase (beta-lactamase class C family)